MVYRLSRTADILEEAFRILLRDWRVNQNKTYPMTANFRHASLVFSTDGSIPQDIRITILKLDIRFSIFKTTWSKVAISRLFKNHPFRYQNGINKWVLNSYKPYQQQHLKLQKLYKTC